MGLMADKLDFMVKELEKNGGSLKANELARLVRRQFGSGIDGSTVKQAILRVNPHYVGHVMRGRSTPKMQLRLWPEAQDGITPAIRKINGKLKAAKIFRSFAKLGISHGVIRAALLDAAGDKPLVFDFDKKQIEKARKLLSSFKPACFVLRRSGKVELVNPAHITIVDGRGHNHG